MPSANLKQHFQTCIKFIKDAIAEGGTVLVHCYAGVSRSTTIVIAYLMQEHGMAYLDAMQHVRKCRWFINPNDGFKRQLQQFSRELAAKRKATGDTKTQEEVKVETTVKAYDRIQDQDVTNKMKNLLIEGRSGSVPPAIKEPVSYNEKDAIVKASYGGGIV